MVTTLLSGIDHAAHYTWCERFPSISQCQLCFVLQINNCIKMFFERIENTFVGTH